MIPKSVSGSSLILALAAVLTWPVWGWAEIATTWTKKHEKDLTHTIVVTQGTHDLYMACGGRICATGATQDEATATMACYQRMREAMQWMAPFNRSYSENKQRDQKFDFERLYQGYPKKAEEWDRTVKDCVEGGK